MSRKIQFRLKFNQSLDKYLQKNYSDVVDYRVLSKSLDARGANRGKTPSYQYNLEVVQDGERFSKYGEDFVQLEALSEKPIIIGAGPAGLFCALRLSEYGIPSIIIERGDEANQRMKKIARFWRYGELDQESNVCFGEGGAGLFSDGKLITRVKSPYVKYIMQRFVDFGAPEEVAYISNPHLGSNKIRNIISSMSDHLRSKGCEIIYGGRVDELLTDGSDVTGVRLSDGREFKSKHTVLAAGHSAKELFEHLIDKKIQMEDKSFAVGVRIEHPRSLIDHIQHGDFQELGSARYRLSWENPQTLKGTYSFCMCPGGYVLSSGTKEEGIVVNGMSNYARNSPWSNSAIVVSVEKGKDFNDYGDDMLAGLKFQEDIEKKAKDLSDEMADGRKLPAMTVNEFLKGELNSNPLPKTSSPSKIFKADIRPLFPNFINEHLKKALAVFDTRMPGFAGDQAVLIAPETRTSSPLTIVRDKEKMVSVSHNGLYPCGEGAGYAGGITSAGVDGVKVAMAILQSEKLLPQVNS